MILNSIFIFSFLCHNRSISFWCWSTFWDILWLLSIWSLVYNKLLLFYGLSLHTIVFCVGFWWKIKWKVFCLSWCRVLCVLMLYFFVGSLNSLLMTMSTSVSEVRNSLQIYNGCSDQMESVMLRTTKNPNENFGNVEDARTFCGQTTVNLAKKKLTR